MVFSPMLKIELWRLSDRPPSGTVSEISDTPNASAMEVSPGVYGATASARGGTNYKNRSLHEICSDALSGVSGSLSVATSPGCPSTRTLTYTGSPVVGGGRPMNEDEFFGRRMQDHQNGYGLYQQPQR